MNNYIRVHLASDGNNVWLNTASIAYFCKVDGKPVIAVYLIGGTSIEIVETDEESFIKKLGNPKTF